jgi:hypothetical protein
VLLGFGLWQVIDVVLFHWIVRIHRIRVDVTHPIWWDIGWMVVFGAPALALAWWLTRRGRGGPPGTWPTGVAASVTGIMFLAAAISLVPAAGTNTVVAVFGDNVNSREAFSSIAESGAEIVWVHESGLVAALRLDRDASRAPLYRAGATLVSGAVSPCAVQAEARMDLRRYTVNASGVHLFAVTARAPVLESESFWALEAGMSSRNLHHLAAS